MSRLLSMFGFSTLIVLGAASAGCSASEDDEKTKETPTTDAPEMNATEPSAICSAGAEAFCRCADRSSGTKTCADDGKSFGECVCDAE